MKYAATGKLGINISLGGEEARAIVEIMDNEGIQFPAAIGRVLIARAVSEYPEWGVRAAMRRNMMMEQRMLIRSRLGMELRTMADELEASIQEDYSATEAEEIDRAQAALTGEGTNEDPS